MNSSAINDALTLTRLAAWYMNDLTKELGLANTAILWNGEDPTQWVVDNAEHIMAVDRHTLVADITLITPLEAEIVIPDNFRLIRDEHLADYDPRHYGIQTLNNPDFKGDTEPDLVINYAIEELPPLLTGPRQYLPEAKAHKFNMSRQYEPGRKLH